MVYIGIKFIFSKGGIGNLVTVTVDGETKKIGYKSTKYIDCVDFEYLHIDNVAGGLDVYFSNIEHYAGGSTLDIDNAAGSINFKYVKFE